MASTSALTLEQHPHQQITAAAPPPNIAPDDSDFLDSDLEVDPEDREIEDAILSEPHPSEIQTDYDARTMATSSAQLKPAQKLIPISQRFWFAFFRQPPLGKRPNEEELNSTTDLSLFKSWMPEAQECKPAWDAGTHPRIHKFHWFNIDYDLVYLSFFHDWGPLNVAMFYRFCLHVHHLLTTHPPETHLVLFTNDTPHEKANAALLAALYAMIIDKVTPADAFHPISEIEFSPFRDAGYGRADFHLSIQDILYGMHRAIAENLLDLTTFNLDEYEKYEQVQNGDWNWLTPNFIAFASPNDREYVAALRDNGGKPPATSIRTRPTKMIANTVRYFKERGVKLVVRLNNPLYDKAVFEDEGIEHEDMYFDDGSNPSDAILRRFIARADEVITAGGVVAVHCKAGLGRTGVLIGAYLIWRHGFSASEVIGFMRMMRPGCVVGPQQHFMYENFAEWIRWGVRDLALKQARETLAAEREELIRQGRLLRDQDQAKGRTSLKRPATPENEDGEGEDDSDLPVTPRARKIPNVKPTPCVGQPRKSPSPSRKRPAIVAPATVARMERTYAGRGAGANNSSSSGSGSDGGRPGLMGISLPRANFNQESGPTTPPSLDRDDDDDNEVGAMLTSGLHSSVRSHGPSGGGVLVEAHRVNMMGPSTPTSPKSAVMATSAAPAAVTTPSPAARIKGHERSRSAIVLGHGTDLTPSSPSSFTSRDTVARASPDIKTRYQLRDVNREDKAMTSPRMDSPPAVAEATVRSDEDVLGAQPVRAEAKTTATTGTSQRPASAAAVTTATTTRTASSATGTQRASSRIASQTRPTSRLTARSRTPSGSASATGSNGTKSTATTTRTTTGRVGTRSVSGKLQDARSALNRANVEARSTAAAAKASAGEVRRAVRAAAVAGDAENVKTVTVTATATMRTRPGSTLTAPTAASAARAAAAAGAAAGAGAGVNSTLKRTRVASREAGVGSFASGTSSRSTSGSSTRIGRSVRRRRSSMGEADVDVVA